MSRRRLLMFRDEGKPRLRGSLLHSAASLGNASPLRDIARIRGDLDSSRPTRRADRELPIDRRVR